MAIHYRATDSRGKVHLRTSRRENSQQYFFAIVRGEGARKSDVSFSSTRDRAEATAREATRYHPNRAVEIVPVEASDKPFKS